MSLDEEQFTTMKLYQSIATSVSFQRCVDALDRFDRHVPGRPLRRGVDLINRVFFITGSTGTDQAFIHQWSRCCHYLL